jgi:hypothetical protein
MLIARGTTEGGIPFCPKFFKYSLKVVLLIVVANSVELSAIIYSKQRSKPVLQSEQIKLHFFIPGSFCSKTADLE